MIVVACCDFQSRRWPKILLSLAVVVLVISLFLWIGFPFIYRNIVYSQLQLSVDEIGMPSRTTFMWSKPPIKTLMKFYMFNVTNPYAIWFYGEKPAVVEIGPFGIWETEQKREYEFNDNQTQVWYKNYKTYVFSEEHSCSTCKYDSLISMPNLPLIGALSAIIDPAYNVSESMQTFFEFAILLLGEYPFVNKPFGEILFDGYDDALLSVAHSDIIKLLGRIENTTYFGKPTVIPIPVPEMPKLAFFYHYNNTNDESYWIDTGKGNMSNYGKVVTWANSSLLPETFYSTKEAREIRGSDSGSFQPPGMTTDSKPDLFMSYLCRSFSLEYYGPSTLSGIKGREFHSPETDFDTTLAKNEGFRYSNIEQVNYFPSWPSCPPKNESVDCSYSTVNCNDGVNLCNTCCNGSFVDGTYLLPPGLVPLPCYPGQVSQPPFTVIYSPPHFAFSPPQVVDNVIGMHPRLPAHVPFQYVYESYSSTVLKIRAQFQMNVPIFPNSRFINPPHFPTAIIPFLWVNASGGPDTYMLNIVKEGFVIVPALVTGFKIGLLALAILVFIFVFVYNVYQHRKHDAEFSQSVDETHPTILHETASPESSLRRRPVGIV